METKQLEHLEKYVAIDTPDWLTFEFAALAANAAFTTCVLGRERYVRLVRLYRVVPALKVEDGAGLYALYLRTPSGAWELV